MYTYDWLKGELFKGMFCWMRWKGNGILIPKFGKANQNGNDLWKQNRHSIILMMLHSTKIKMLKKWSGSASPRIQPKIFLGQATLKAQKT